MQGNPHIPCLTPIQSLFECTLQPSSWASAGPCQSPCIALWDSIQTQGVGVDILREMVYMHEVGGKERSWHGRGLVLVPLRLGECRSSSRCRQVACGAVRSGGIRLKRRHGSCTAISTVMRLTNTSVMFVMSSRSDLVFLTPCVRGWLHVGPSMHDTVAESETILQLTGLSGH